MEHFTAKERALLTHLISEENLSVWDAIDTINNIYDGDKIENEECKVLGHSFTVYEECESTEKMDVMLDKQLDEILESIPISVAVCIDRDKYKNNFETNMLGEQYARGSMFSSYNGEEYPYDVEDTVSVNGGVFVVYKN